MNLRLIHLSDIHFGGEDAAATEAAVAAAWDFAPHLTIVTGDLTLNGLPREFRAARSWLDRLPTPILVTPGNHDTPYWNLPLRALVPFDRYHRFIGPPHHTEVQTPDVTAHAINTARGAQPRLNWSLGAIDLDLVDRLTVAIAAAPQALSVLACHHPLIDIVGAPVHGGVRRGEAAAGRLAAAGVDLILTGHLHVPFAIALPHGSQRSYACGAGTLSLRTRGTPASYLAIEADAKNIAVTDMAWTGSHFAPAQSWTLPRRAPPSEDRGAQAALLTEESGSP